MYSNMGIDNRNCPQNKAYLNLESTTGNHQQLHNTKRKDPHLQASYNLCKEDSRAAAAVEYSNVWQQQQHYNSHNWQSTGMTNNRNYVNNLPKYASANRMHTFQNPRPLYMQFSPYLAQRTIIASQNPSQPIPQRSESQSNEIQQSMRFGDYDFVQR